MASNGVPTETGSETADEKHPIMNVGAVFSTSGHIAATVRRATMFAWRSIRHPTWAEAHLRSWLEDDRKNYFDGAVSTVSVRVALCELTGCSPEAVDAALAAVPRPALQRPSINPVTDNGSSELIQFLYALCMLLRPARVVETGVSNGTTTAVILEALKQCNPNGRLLSIDLPWLHPRAAKSVGSMVSEAVMSQWTLKLGAADRSLRAAERGWAPINIFVQDASHSFGGQLREYRAGWRLLGPGGILVSDDVGKAMAEFGREMNAVPFYVGQKKNRPIGVLVKHAKCI